MKPSSTVSPLRATPATAVLRGVGREALDLKSIDRVGFFHAQRHGLLNPRLVPLGIDNGDFAGSVRGKRRTGSRRVMDRQPFFPIDRFAFRLTRCLVTIE